MSTLIQGIHHVAIRPTAANYDRTVDFYTNLLGMRQTYAWGEGDSRCCMISTGDNSYMEILGGGASDALPTGPLDHIAFATDKVDELVEIVRNAGYEITTEPKDAELPSTPALPIRIAFCTGPANEIVEFFRVRS